MRKKAKIGLALGSGASRGLAHIGVLQVLEEHGIVPDYIAGSSIGALIGGLYACGISPRMMEGLASHLDSKLYYDVTVPRHGFIQGKRIEELLKLLTQNKEFKETKIPFAVTATDLKKCKLVVIKEGKLYKAIRASISIPGIFVPVKTGDQVLVDGGVLERVPVSVVKEMGADIVVGVDVGFRGEHREANGILEVILQSLEVMELEILKTRINQSDIMIYPSINNVNPLSFDEVEERVQIGRQATMEVIEELKEKIRLAEEGAAS